MSCTFSAHLYSLPNTFIIAKLLPASCSVVVCVVAGGVWNAGLSWRVARGGSSGERRQWRVARERRQQLRLVGVRGEHLHGLRSQLGPAGPGHSLHWTARPRVGHWRRRRNGPTDAEPDWSRVCQRSCGPRSTKYMYVLPSKCSGSRWCNILCIFRWKFSFFERNSRATTTVILRESRTMRSWRTAHIHNALLVRPHVSHTNAHLLWKIGRYKAFVSLQGFLSCRICCDNDLQNIQSWKPAFVVARQWQHCQPAKVRLPHNCRTCC